MSDTERQELLKAVAACAPAGMGAQYIHRNENDDHEVFFYGALPTKPPTVIETTLYLADDYYDSEAIIAMLDFMEGAGRGFTVSQSPDGGYMAYPNPWMSHIRGHAVGATRAEAVARAFVAVFTREAPNA